MNFESIGWWAFALIVGILILEFTLAHVTAKAARMKGRSYASFYWLSLLFRPVIIWLIIASLPFHKNDPRSPLTDTKADQESDERYVNDWAAQPLLGTPEWILIGVGLALTIIAAVNLLAPVVQYYEYYLSSFNGGGNE